MQWLSRSEWNYDSPNNGEVLPKGGVDLEWNNESLRREI
jgi:hypothetical protein